MPLDKKYMQAATAPSSSATPLGSVLTVTVPRGYEAKVLEYVGKMWQAAQPRESGKRQARQQQAPKARAPKVAEEVRALREVAQITTSPRQRRALLRQIEDKVEQLTGSSSTDTDEETAASTIEKLAKATTMAAGLKLEKAVHNTMQANIRSQGLMEEPALTPLPVRQPQRRDVPATSGKPRYPAPRFVSKVAADLVEMGNQPVEQKFPSPSRRPLPSPSGSAAPLVPVQVVTHAQHCDTTKHGPKRRCTCGAVVRHDIVRHDNTCDVVKLGVRGRCTCASVLSR